jgi:hypothetical protein
MITLSQLTLFLGWAAALNIGFLIVTTIMLVSMKSFITPIHSKLFAITEDTLGPIYFRYLANYKSLSLIFFVMPYCALKIMGY